MSTQYVDTLADLLKRRFGCTEIVAHYIRWSDFKLQTLFAVA